MNAESIAVLQDMICETKREIQRLVVVVTISKQICLDIVLK